MQLRRATEGAIVRQATLTRSWKYFGILQDDVTRHRDSHRSSTKARQIYLLARLLPSTGGETKSPDSSQDRIYDKSVSSWMRIRLTCKPYEGKDVTAIEMDVYSALMLE
jgi:hypothetical protein